MSTHAVGETRAGSGAATSIRERLYALATFQRWYWALVPALALAAYVTVLRIGFLSEDMGLNRTALGDSGWRAIWPNPGLRFYRPLGFLLTWRINWPLFGLNPVPYHLEGLLVHAAVAWVLGLWVADMTGHRWLGWLSGALFAVYPINTEAVGWLATQWDLWAALFGTLSIWLFMKWWRGDGGTRSKQRWLYAGSALFYFLGVFTKESVFAFLPLLALAAWYVRAPGTWKRWTAMLVALLPHVGVLALNLGVRQIAWGGQRNYDFVSNDYLSFMWDQTVEHMRPVLSPILSVIFGERAVQIVAAVSFALLMVGLVLYGRGIARLLLVAAAWMAVALAPVLNIGILHEDYQNSRLVYLVTAGYSIVVAALVWSALQEATRWRATLLRVATAVVLVACVAVTWAQLRPWHTASVMAQEVESELARLIPIEARPQGMVWYLQNVPDRYQGAWVLSSAIARTRYLPNLQDTDIPDIQRLDDVSKAPLGADGRDSFALRWQFYPDEPRWHIDYGQGITADAPPPTTDDTGKGLRVWDFRECDPQAVSEWRAPDGTSTCEKGRGLLTRGDSRQVQMIHMKVFPSAVGDRFLRLAASVQYDTTQPGQAPTALGVWSWAINGMLGDWYATTPISGRLNSGPRVYWTFLPAAQLGGVVTGLRFQSLVPGTTAWIHWIAVDTVK